MWRPTSDMTLEHRESMRGGKGVVTIQHIFHEAELHGGARLVAHLSLPPGSSIGYHTHEQEEEIYYITCGEALVNDNGTSRILKQGEALLTGGGAGHSIENGGDGPLELMAVILNYHG